MPKIQKIKENIFEIIDKDWDLQNLLYCLNILSAVPRSVGSLQRNTNYPKTKIIKMLSLLMKHNIVFKRKPKIRYCGVQTEYILNPLIIERIKKHLKHYSCDVFHIDKNLKVHYIETEYPDEIGEEGL